MNDQHEIGETERELMEAVPRPAPSQLRSAVLKSVQSELRSARYDRLLARIAVTTMGFAMALNLSVGWRAHQQELAANLARPATGSIVEVANTISLVTDEQTGKWFERQLAVLGDTAELAPQAAAAWSARDEIIQSWILSRKEG